MDTNATERHASSDALLTLPEAARRLGLSMRQLRRARERCELPFYVIGGWRRVRLCDVANWIESKRRAPIT